MTSRWLPRPISVEEAAVVRATLERAPKNGEPSPLLAAVEALVVVDRCKCGCRSIDFQDPRGRPEPDCAIVADGLGKTPSGKDVGVIVWGFDDAITGLEIYDFEPESAVQLPLVNSIRPWDETERGSA